MQTLLLQLFVSSILVSMPNTHPIHVSFTHIEYHDSEQYFDVVFKVFTDDFENIMAQKYQVDLNIGKENQIANIKTHVNRYFSEHFNIRVNGKQIPDSTFQFEKKKNNDMEVWFFYTIKCSEKPEKMVITNSILNDLFHDQTNLLIAKYNDTEMGITYTFNKTTDTIIFK